MYDNFDALILSAGLSSRMGKTKALLNWHGKKLIEFHIDVLNDLGIRNINLVLGHDKEKIIEVVNRKKIKIIINKNYLGGKSTSILEGINNIEKDTQNLLLISVDQPRPKWFLKKIIDFHIDNKSIISAPIDKNKRGHPIMFNKEFIPNLTKINEYPNGLRDLFRENNNIVMTDEIKSQWTHLDLNNNEIYEKALSYKLFDE